MSSENQINTGALRNAFYLQHVNKFHETEGKVEIKIQK